MSDDMRTLAIITEHQALIAEQITKMEGMKAENAACVMEGQIPLYMKQDFDPIMIELGRLAYSVRQLVEP